MFFFLGLLCGAILFLLFFGKDLDRLHLQILSLQNENSNYLQELQKLKEDEQKAKRERNMIVEDVVVHILEPKPDPFTEEELIRLIERDTKYLEGKPLESVNDLHYSLRQQFKDRSFKVGERYVRTELKTMTIFKTIHLYIYAKVEQSPP